MQLQPEGSDKMNLMNLWPYIVVNGLLVAVVWAWMHARYKKRLASEKARYVQFQQASSRFMLEAKRQVAQLNTDLAAARLAVAEAARRVDRAPGEPDTNRWVWRAKLLAGDAAADVASSMLEAAGTSASRRGHPLERLYRDARCGALQPATSDVCADWLGAAAAGGDPDVDAAVPRW